MKKKTLVPLIIFLLGICLVSLIVYKTDAPWSDTYKVVYQSDGQINHPVSYTFTIGDENWKFEVTPKSGWRNATLLIIIIGIFLTISLLLSVLTRVWLVAKEHKKKFQILARTDSLTNIYNRYGFDEFAEKMIQKIQKHILWLRSLISMISSLLMISMDIITETGH